MTKVLPRQSGSPAMLSLGEWFWFCSSAASYVPAKTDNFSTLDRQSAFLGRGSTLRMLAMRGRREKLSRLTNWCFNLQMPEKRNRKASF